MKQQLTLQEWQEYLVRKLRFSNRNDWGDSSKYCLYIKTLGGFNIYMSIHFDGECLLIILNNSQVVYNDFLNPCTIEEFQSKILDNTSIGDTVIDCCMGGGSTGMMSKKNGRNFIGIELDEKYFNIAKDFSVARIYTKFNEYTDF